jgi:hypothetical protein
MQHANSRLAHSYKPYSLNLYPRAVITMATCNKNLAAQFLIHSRELSAQLEVNGIFVLHANDRINLRVGITPRHAVSAAAARHRFNCDAMELVHVWIANK